MGKFKLLSVLVLTLALAACSGPTYAYEPFGNREIITELAPTKQTYEQGTFYNEEYRTLFPNTVTGIDYSESIFIDEVIKLSTSNNIFFNSTDFGFYYAPSGEAIYHTSLVLKEDSSHYMQEFEKNGEYPVELEEVKKQVVQLFDKGVGIFMGDNIELVVDVVGFDDVIVFQVTETHTYDYIDATY